MKKKWLWKISKVLIWIPTVILIVGIDPQLVRNIGWSESYLPLLLSVGVALDYDLRGLVEGWWQRKVSVLIGLMVLYWQILRMSNWFEVGLVIIWLVYLTRDRLIRILKARQNEDIKTGFKPPNKKTSL